MITEFRGETGFLSNFVECSIEFEGKIYKSVENAYMAAKNDSIEWRNFCLINSAGACKKASRSLTFHTRKGWYKDKLEVMESLLIKKFNQEPFKTLLIKTGEQVIQEGNWWNDKFWGVCLKTNEGENNLGKLLMKIRKDLQNER